jgi:hypothetical protein
MDRRRRRPKELEEGPFLGLINREATKSYRSAATGVGGFG